MNDALRSYPRSLRQRPARSQSRVIRALSRSLVLVLIVVSIPAGGYYTWIARDSHGVDEFISAGRPLEVVLWEPLASRNDIARSALWDSLPDDSAILAARALLESDFGLPPWVLRNLAGEYVYFSGDGASGLDDVLVVTRVSRVGTAIERMYRFSPKVDKEVAGGMTIRRWNSEGVYYALEGRILLASPSRRTLINALTLSIEERKDPRDVEALFSRGRESIKGTYASGDGAGEYFQSLSFAANVSNSNVAIKVHGLLRDDVQEQFEDLLGDAPAATLPTIPSGPFQVAANFGRPIRELWSALGKAFDSGLLSEAQWSAWESDGTDGFASAITGLLGDAGPRFSAAWRGFDLDEIAPAPIFVGAVNAGDVESLASFGDEGKARYDSASGILRIFSVSGPAFETTAKRDGKRILVSSNGALAETFFDDATAFEKSPGVAKFFVGLAPGECMDLLLEAGALLAENDMLEGHRPESWQATVDEWRLRYGRVERATALVSADGGRVTADVNVAFGDDDGAERSVK